MYKFRFLTCDNPRYIETVSDMYKNLPSAATDNAKPSRDCKKKKILKLVLIL